MGDQYIWESDGGEGYSIIKDPRGNTLPRGTQISLYLKEEAHDFLKTDSIKNLVNKYSQFINFPISIWQEVEEEREVALTEEEIEEAKIKKEAEKKKKKSTCVDTTA